MSTIEEEDEKKNFPDIFLPGLTLKLDDNAAADLALAVEDDLVTVKIAKIHADLAVDDLFPVDDFQPEIFVNFQAASKHEKESFFSICDQMGSANPLTFCDAAAATTHPLTNMVLVADEDDPLDTAEDPSHTKRYACTDQAGLHYIFKIPAEDFETPQGENSHAILPGSLEAISFALTMVSRGGAESTKQAMAVGEPFELKGKELARALDDDASGALDAEKLKISLQWNRENKKFWQVLSPSEEALVGDGKRIPKEVLIAALVEQEVDLLGKWNLNVKLPDTVDLSGLSVTVDARVDGLDGPDRMNALPLLGQPDGIARDGDYVRFEFSLDRLVEVILDTDKESEYFNLPMSLRKDAHDLMRDLKDGKDVEAAARAVLHNVFARAAKSVHVRIKVKEADAGAGGGAPLLAEIDVIGLETNEMWVS